VANKVSIVSVAFGGYEKYIPSFVKMATKFSNDIIIETERRPMGEMRNRAVAKAKHKYIISLDIDDLLFDIPDATADFVGLDWVERNKILEQSIPYTFCLPSEKRKATHTYRSNIMFTKKLWSKCNFKPLDYYIYDFLLDAYQLGATMAHSGKPCVVYNKTKYTPKSDGDDEYKTAWETMRKLERVTR